MKLRTHVKWHREGRASGYLLDSRTGNIHTLNETAAALLEALEQGADVGALEEHMRASFQVGELAAREDVTAFTQLLLENDLVQH